MRLRLEHSTWPRPGLYLTDTPDPKCPDCAGEGGFEQEYGDENGEYAGTHTWPCTCWNPADRRLVLPLFRRRVRTSRDPWSDEPPF
ncbi:hypothetical protein ABT160_10495 [Streptomyces sp. NPDC001941]|uniref:hypothetical protein n=1 Tax=Streptomyces sp. NPDC001941 TaxID=3154659 RepID=UPI003321F317